jgi:hypothetical protein
MMLVVEHALHPRGLVHLEHVDRRERHIVVLEHQAPTDRFTEPLPRVGPPPQGGFAVAVDAADMDHQHRLRPALHQVEHLGLRGKVPHAFLRQVVAGGVEHDELRRMEAETHVGIPRQPADARQVARTLTDHAVELRHVRMGGVGRHVRGHAIHVNAVGAQVVDHAADVAE